MSLHNYLHDEITMTISDTSIVPNRTGWFRRVNDTDGRMDLFRYVGGKLPYYYRKPENIAKDFMEEHDFLTAIAHMAVKPPQTEGFQSTHFAEILCCIYLREVLNYKILSRKLTQLTSEDTNVHKMDVMCVDVSQKPYRYLWVEAKSSRQTGQRVYHNSGIYKQMRDSLTKYTDEDVRYDFVHICDNMSQADFSEEERRIIRQDLLSPSGPPLVYHGMAVINIDTHEQSDVDKLLSEPCNTSFDVRLIALTDLKALAVEAYSFLEDTREAFRSIGQRGVH